MRLLIGKVNQLRYLLKVATLLAKFINAALLAVHNKSRVLKGLDITVHRTIGYAKSLRHILYGVIIVARHHLH